MRVLYQTTSALPYNEFKILHRQLHGVKYCLASVLLLTPPLVLIPYYFVDFRWITMLIVILMSTAAIAAYLIIHERALKRCYEIYSAPCDIRLYDDRLVQNISGKEYTAEYYAIGSIIETGRFLHLRISRERTISLDKAACSAEMISCLKSRIKGRRLRHSGIRQTTATLASVLICAMIMRYGIFEGDLADRRFSTGNYACPICNRVKIGTIAAQQQWVHDIHNWEYDTVGALINAELT